MISVFQFWKMYLRNVLRKIIKNVKKELVKNIHSLYYYPMELWKTLGCSYSRPITNKSTNRMIYSEKTNILHRYVIQKRLHISALNSRKSLKNVILSYLCGTYYSESSSVFERDQETKIVLMWLVCLDLKMASWKIATNPKIYSLEKI